MDKAIAGYIEHRLYNYNDTMKKLELCTQGAIDEISPAYIRHSQKMINAIDKSLAMLGNKHIDLFWYKYQVGLPWQEVALKMDVSERTYFRLRKSLLTAIGQNLGLINIP